MQRSKVQSSNVASIGYDAASRILEVEFLNGTVYDYFDVPQAIYTGIMGAASHGSYLAQFVKGKFKYKQIL